MSLEQVDDATTPAGVDPAAVLPDNIRPYVAVPALNSMQVEAIPLVLGTARNVVIAAPTGSGKTLVAEIALLQECRERDRSGVYLAPMRAIAAEKRDDWQRLEALGLNVYKTTGEDDAFDPSRALAADIIVATPEKWDSIGRRALAPALVARIGVIVMDEVHLVDEGQRGAGQEAMLARVPRLFPGARIIAMSGTLANADAIARWLDAELYESRWRPIALTKTIQPYRPVGQWEQDEEARSRIAATIAREVVAADGAALVFCGSRKGVERCALALARSLGLSPPARQQFVSSAPLRQALAGGVGFHHAGLAREARAAEEGLFRSGAVKVLVATSTDAAGVNLPARAVVVRDLQLGASDLSASGLLQMAGRAGRPGLETEGYCYVVAPEKDVDRVKGMLGGHPVGSRLGDDLATHINTEIALGLVASRADVAAWYARTLHRHIAPRPADLDKPLRFLLDEGFVAEEDGALRPTGLGGATSDLMIRVASAAALERYIAADHRGTADPDALETEILIAACGLPVELDELADRGVDDTLRRALGAFDERLAGWSQGRLEYLAVAACLLSGLPVEGLTIENPGSVRAAVGRELPRYLTFLARPARPTSWSRRPTSPRRSSTGSRTEPPPACSTCSDVPCPPTAPGGGGSSSATPRCAARASRASRTRCPTSIRRGYSWRRARRGRRASTWSTAAWSRGWTIGAGRCARMRASRGRARPSAAPSRALICASCPSRRCACWAIRACTALLSSWSSAGRPASTAGSTRVA